VYFRGTGWCGSLLDHLDLAHDSGDRCVPLVLITLTADCADNLTGIEPSALTFPFGLRIGHGRDRLSNAVQMFA